jgi:hypothetical protein
LAITVDDLDKSCERFESLGVKFKKRPSDGNMKTIAFILDPDGYWVEVGFRRKLDYLLGIDEAGRSSRTRCSGRFRSNTEDRIPTRNVQENVFENCKSIKIKFVVRVLLRC